MDSERAWEDSAVLNLYVIYERPRDYPEKWVVRRWELGRQGWEQAEPKEVVALCDTLAEARRKVPGWLCNIGRMKEDDPTIVEVWI